jgi:hypothetical protein
MNENTEAHESKYQSYLLRLWRVDSGAHSTWRASLDDPRTGKRLGFASLEQLFAFLMDETEGGASRRSTSDSSPITNSRGERS